MGRFARSWDMTKTSFKVIKEDKELLWLPVLSFLATVVMLGGIFGAGWAAGIFPEVTDENGDVQVPAAILGFLTYLALAFVQVFFHAATIAGAHERLSGGDPTVGSAVKRASQHLGRLFLWSLMVATVNIILQAIRERSGPVGDFMAGLAGVAWNLATYFVVPVLLYEDGHIGTALKRSGGLFKRNWGEQVIGDVGIGLVGFVATVVVVLMGLLVTMLLSGLGAVGIGIGIGLTVLAVILVSVMFTVAAAVYKTALYRFATSGQAGGEFTPTQMSSAFRPKHG